MSDDIPSRQQEAWIKLSAEWRLRVQAAMPKAPMTPAEAKEYGQALDEAFSLELNAMRMDGYVEQITRGY